MRKLQFALAGVAALALAGCDRAAEPADADTMEAVEETEAMDPAVDGGDVVEGEEAAEPAEGAMEGEEDALAQPDELPMEDSEFDPTGNPIGPGNQSE